MRRLGSIALVFCLSTAQPIFAQQWQVFDMLTAGFPSNTILDVVQDGQGTIWAATDWGLCQYTNGTWSVIQQDAAGLPSNSLSCLAVDSLDRLWIGTVTDGIAILDDGDWSYLNATNSPIITEGVRSMTHDHRGWVWIGTEAGLHCWTGSEWRLYNNTPQSHNGYEFFGNNIANVAVRADGLVTVATRNAGLVYLMEDDFLYYTASSSNFPDNSANEIVFDSAGDRWLACPSAGLIRHAGPYNDLLWFPYNAQSVGFPNNTMNCLAIGTNDLKVVGTETWGLLLFQDPGNWSALNAQNSGLPNNDVRSVLVDDQGVIWAGTFLGGLARYDPATAIEETETFGSKLKFYPNPCQDRVFLELQEWIGFVEWMLVDALGRSVDSGRITGGPNAELTFGPLKPGCYSLRVASQEKVQIGRLVIQ